MPRVKTIVPAQPSREKGQRSLDEMFINRFIPPWAQPHWQKAEFWRTVVRQLPAATTCKEHIVSHISSLDWKIEPRESTQRDELKSEIEYHTELFESGGFYDRSGWDYLKMTEWALHDALDIPFGTAFETIREGDKPDGRVLFIIPIDGSSLFPTRDSDWPVAQRLQGNPIKTVVFPWYAINRFYYSPRNEIKYEGWGMPPPEKIFLALEMIRRGDIYFSKFLADTPEAGVLDLLDMDRKSAEEWVKAFKDLFTGIEPMKIPVLYEHTTAAKWIPFGKDPNTLQFDQTYSRYITLTCAGYGISPTDIGFPSKGGGGGETMSGSIRDERRTKRTGIARTKKGLKYFFNRMLPKSLQFSWIDLDDEISVAKSRAFLAFTTAASQAVETGLYTEKEMRLQSVQDGLVSIPIPEEVPMEEFIVKPGEFANANERPGMLGSPVNPSQGGKGEITSRSEFENLLHDSLNFSDIQIRKLAKAIAPAMLHEVNTVLEELAPEEYRYWIEWHNDALWGNLEDIPELTLSTIKLSGNIVNKIVKNEKWINPNTTKITSVVNDLVQSFREFRESEIIYNSVMDYEAGKSASYLKEVEPNLSLEKRLKSDIRKEIRHFISNLDISKPILEGVRNSIIKTGFVELLDNVENINDNICVITNVRESLAKFYDRKLSDFHTLFESKLNQYLEEDLNE